MKTLITNAKIITPEEILDGYSLLLEDGYIKGLIAPEAPVPEINRTIDGEGNYLAPGMIDIHNHGNSGYDTMDATPEALESIATYHLKNGVTGYLATTVTSPHTMLQEAIDNVVEFQKHQAWDDAISTLLGIYFEGPFFNVKKKGAQPEKDIQTPDLKALKSYVEKSPENFKVVALAPELEGSLEVIQFLHESGIQSAFAHTDATYEDTMKGIDAGMRIATHMYNGMRGFTHREPGALGAALTDDRVISELIVDGVHLHKAAVDLALKTKGPERIVLISDAMRAAGLDDGTYELGGQTVVTKDGEAHLEDGTIAGSTLNLNKAVKNIVRDNHVSVEDAFRMASLNPAKVIGLDSELGSIEASKRADLVFLDENLDVLRVFKAGQEVYRR
ncbi:MAG: N-acetylglucosamine-6-phosphate deacetylase [Bacillota bacterium]